MKGIADIGAAVERRIAHASCEPRSCHTGHDLVSVHPAGAGRTHHCRDILQRWKDALPDPDWYVGLESDIRRYILPQPKSAGDRQIRWAIYDLVADALDSDQIGLAQNGFDRDAQRKPIEYVVLHHSGGRHDVSISRLSGMGLLRLYAPCYLDDARSPRIRGKAIHSGHWIDGRQVFHAYHWLIRADGQTERLLEDQHIGWHAGNWAVNCASIGICLAGDFSGADPSDRALAALHELLEQYAPTEVVLHGSVNPSTDCPGAWAKAVRWNMG